MQFALIIFSILYKIFAILESLILTNHSISCLIRECHRKEELKSKSKGNVVSPDALVNDYGCDSLRMYELFVGPPE